ncbi:MAG: hypothetical protein ACYDH9_25350 [Limisphaerales bacterium]
MHTPPTPGGVRRRIHRLRTALVVSVSAALGLVHAAPPGTIHYPDLVTLAPGEVGIQYSRTTGQKLLRFSNTIANYGEGPLDLIPVNNSTKGTTDAYQILWSHDANNNWHAVSTNYVGTFAYYSNEKSWYFENFAQSP